jgi:chemotaxis protein methyltransferase CheR
LPSLRKNFPSDFQYRFWCAASSFGQEPFSLSMLVDDFLQTQPGHPRISILGTDVAEHALKRCREAKYSQLEVQRGLPALKLVKAFNKGPEEGYWTLKSDVTSRVEFRKQNLLESFLSLGKFHVILCRYVLIYQDAEKKKAIVQALEQALHPKGFLVFGASESAFGLSTNLDQMSIDGAIIYQKKS